MRPEGRGGWGYRVTHTKNLLISGIFLFLVPYPAALAFARRERWALRHGRREDLAVLRAISTLLLITSLLLPKLRQLTRR